MPWSLATISNNHVSRYAFHAPDPENIRFNGNYEAFVERVRKSGAVVIQAKGATFYAVAFSVCHIVKCILNGSGTALTVSTMMNGEYGVSDVCLSVPVVVNSEGIRKIIELPLCDEEREALQKSAHALRSIIDQLD